MEHSISVKTAHGTVMSVEKFKNSGLSLQDAVGIVLQTQVVGMIISFDCWQEKWGDNQELIDSEKDWSENLMGGLSGLQLTKQIVDFQQKSNYKDMSAAKRCWEYQKGGLQWYLPSVYELCAIRAFKNEIFDAMIAIGIDEDEEAMLKFDDWFWSSWEHSRYNAVHVNFASGWFSGHSKDSSLYVRAVSAFEPLPCFNSLICEQGEQITFSPSLFSDEVLIAEMKSRGFAGEVVKTFKL